MAYFGRTALRRFARLFILFLRNKRLRIGVSVLFLLNLFLCSFLLLFFGLRLLLYLRLFLFRLFLLRFIRLLGNRCCGLFRSLLFVVRLYGCRLYLFLLRLGLFSAFSPFCPAAAALSCSKIAICSASFLFFSSSLAFFAAALDSAPVAK